MTKQVHSREPAFAYGHTVNAKERTIYHVECIWPCEKSQARWGRYQPSAWNDRRTPNTRYDGYGDCAGTFDRMNEDVATHPSRVGRKASAGWKVGDYEEAPAFTDPVAALAYAERLAEHGELASKYDNMTHIEGWRERHSGKVRTRVVEERSAIIERVVVRKESV